MHPTPLCGDKIVAILYDGFNLIVFPNLSCMAARVMGNPLDGNHHTRA
jgi:hypothetical protein